MDLRQLHEELGAELPHLTWDQLKELAEFAKVSVDKVRKKHIIVHLINEEIDVVIEKEDKDAASQFIGDVLEVIKQMKKKPGTLTGRAVNQTDIPFSGWIEVKFQLDTSDTSNKGPLVPLLVSKTPGVAEEPIIGYNVIEHLLQHEKEQPSQATINTLTAAFSVDCKRAEWLIRLVKQGDSSTCEGTVRGSRQRTRIPPGETKMVKCSVRTVPLTCNQEMLFVPES
ncbi:uncharacterized protein LOC109204700 [Tachysurus ichikawai]